MYGECAERGNGAEKFGFETPIGVDLRQAGDYGCFRQVHLLRPAPQGRSIASFADFIGELDLISR